jgi:hypothetical protein
MMKGEQVEVAVAGAMMVVVVAGVVQVAAAAQPGALARVAAAAAGVIAQLLHVHLQHCMLRRSTVMPSTP